MKKILATVILSGISMLALAQNSKIRSAEDALKDKKYDDAKADIEAALQNDKTKNSAHAWYVNGEVHGAIATEKKDPQEALVAYDAYKKAMDIEPKNPQALLTLTQNLSNLYVVMGNSAYADLNSQKYDSAFSKFMSAYDIANYLTQKGTGSIPTDTAMVFYTGYAAYQSGHKDSAFSYLKRAAELQFKGEPYLYLTLAKIYEDKGDNDNAIAMLDTGKKVFPTNNNFSLQEIDLYQKTGKTDQLIKKMEDEVASDPNNYAVTLNLAIAYDNMASPRDASGDDAAKPANADEYLQKAVNYYKKAIALKPDEYPGNFNVGLLYYNQAVQYGKEIGTLSSSQADQKKADSLAAKQNGFLDEAFPYLEKTFQILDAKDKLDPNELSAYKSTLTGLKSIYARKNQTDKYNEADAKLKSADDKAK